MNRLERGVIAPEEEVLQWLQTQAWREGDWTDKAWWTPIPRDFLRQAWNNSYTGDLLVVGCGDGSRELSCAESIGWQVVAFDVNEKLIQRAARLRRDSRLPFVQRTAFFVGDLLVLPLRAERDFAAASLVGVATSLMGRNLDKALAQIAPVIRSQGYLIISDFMISLKGQTFIERIESERGWRYLRDAAAIHTVIGSVPWEVEEELSGMIVIRPRGLPWRKALDLSFEEVAQAIKEGDFERLAQHRNLADFQRSLEGVGFAVIDHKVRPAYPVAIEKEARRVEKEDVMINIQILAQKKPLIE